MKKRYYGKQHKGVGICGICKGSSRSLVIKKGQIYNDQHGNKQRSADLMYHAQCRSMQDKGLLNTHNS